MQSPGPRFVAPFFLCLTLCFVPIAFSSAMARQETVPQQSSTSRPKRRSSSAVGAAHRRNPQIAKIVSEIDSRRIENAIRKLVSFGTRNSLSDQNDPQRGIGAARARLVRE